jgi:hypothetical protein
MKKICFLLLAVFALFSFSCNHYCNCDHYIDGKLDKDYKAEFVFEQGKCAEYSQPATEIEGVTYELKCK